MDRIEGNSDCTIEHLPPGDDDSELTQLLTPS